MSARHGGVDRAHLVHRAGAEGHADIGDPLQRVQVEVEIAGEAAEAAHIDDAPAHRRRLHGLVGETARDLVDYEIHARAAGGLARLLHPGRIAGVEDHVGAEFGEARPPAGIAGGGEHRAGALEAGDLQRHEPDAGARTLDEDGGAGRDPAVGDQRIVHGLQRDRQRRRLDRAGAGTGQGAHPAPVGDGILGIAAGARAHHPVAGPELGNLGADLGDLAGPFEPRHRVHAAQRPVGPPGRHDQVRPVQPAGRDPDQNLVGLGRGHRHLADRQPLAGKHHCLHSPSPLGCGSRRMPGRCGRGAAPSKRPATRFALQRSLHIV